MAFLDDLFPAIQLGLLDGLFIGILFFLTIPLERLSDKNSNEVHQRLGLICRIAIAGTLGFVLVMSQLQSGSYAAAFKLTVNLVLLMPSVLAFFLSGLAVLAFFVWLSHFPQRREAMARSKDTGRPDLG